MILGTSVDPVRGSVCVHANDAGSKMGAARRLDRSMGSFRHAGIMCPTGGLQKDGCDRSFLVSTAKLWDILPLIKQIAL